ncbi:allergin-1 [Carettochelys insculpta]|uniref:allergin-1 n=1 Tax=Carettochelys insculpta TaxID=44489 RepID=UPI003EB6F921
MSWIHPSLQLVLCAFVPHIWKLFVDCCFLSLVPLSKPELKSLQPSLEIGIGQNITLSCRSTNSALPINYTFFRSQSWLSITTMQDKNSALLNLTITSASDLGEYKCKAEDGFSNRGKYSNGLNFTLLDPVSKPVLRTTTSEVRIGQNVTLSCHSENGSLPIKYTFFKENKAISTRTCELQKSAAMLNITISSSSDLSNYKCKAENKIPNTTKYSKSLNFTLAEDDDGLAYPLCIFLGLLFLLVVIATALMIPFLILPWCKARKLKSTGSYSAHFFPTDKGSENYLTYTEIEHVKSEEVAYANLSTITKKEEDRKVNTRRDNTVIYSEVIMGDGMQGSPYLHRKLSSKHLDAGFLA